MNKLLIRADILAAVANLQAQSTVNESNISEIVNNLKAISNTDFVMETLIKELLKSEDEKRLGVISFLLTEIIPNDVLDENIQKLLLSKDMADYQKYKLIKVMRNMGVVLKYENFEQYLDEPEAIINEDTTILLQNSMTNPELQIDFLDFISAIPPEDATLLIESLVDDYQGDMLVNLLMPILYAMPDSAQFVKVVELLGETKSKKALELLNTFKAIYKDNELILARIKKSVSMLKLSTAQMPDVDSTLNLEGKIYQCYISMPDGMSNQGLIVSRIRDDHTIQMFSVVVNLKDGIVDSFGFNEISIAEFEKIVDRFYLNQTKIQISAEIAKSILDTAEEICFNSKEKISYEYICWKVIMSDVNDLTESKENIFKANLKKSKPSAKDLAKLYDMCPVLENWYYDEDNDTIQKMLSEIFEYQNSKKEPTLKFLDSMLEKYFLTLFTEDEQELINEKLLMTAYLYSILGENKAANLLYSIIYDSEAYSNVLMNLLEMSVYSFFVRQKERQAQEFMAKNIFQVKTKKNQEKFSQEFIEKVLYIIETEWTGDE